MSRIIDRSETFQTTLVLPRRVLHSRASMLTTPLNVFDIPFPSPQVPYLPVSKKPSDISRGFSIETRSLHFRTEISFCTSSF